MEPPSVTDASGRQLVVEVVWEGNGTYRVLLIF